MSEDITQAPEGAEPAAPRAERTDRGDRGDRGPGGPDGDRGPGRGGPRRRFPRRKLCYFSQIKADYVDWKDVDTLKRFVSESGKIVPRRVTGTTAAFQRELATAIKRARYMALLPYTTLHK